MLVSGSYDNTVVVWDVDNEMQKLQLQVRCKICQSLMLTFPRTLSYSAMMILLPGIFFPYLYLYIHVIRFNKCKHITRTESSPFL